MFILIVEPEVGRMEAVYTVLLREGFQYGFVRCKEDAINVLATSILTTRMLYDFVVVDYASPMPGMTGAEFQKLLSINKSGPKIIFVFAKSAGKPTIELKDCKWLAAPFADEVLLSLLS